MVLWPESLNVATGQTRFFTSIHQTHLRAPIKRWIFLPLSLSCWYFSLSNLTVYSSLIPIEGPSSIDLKSMAYNDSACGHKSRSEKVKEENQDGNGQWIYGTQTWLCVRYESERKIGFIGPLWLSLFCTQNWIFTHWLAIKLISQFIRPLSSQKSDFLMP